MMLCYPCGPCPDEAFRASWLNLSFGRVLYLERLLFCSMLCGLDELYTPQMSRCSAHKSYVDDDSCRPFRGLLALKARKVIRA